MVDPPLSAVELFLVLKYNKSGFEKEQAIKKYEYKFVEVKIQAGLKTKAGVTFEECKQVIVSEAEQGWQLKQVVTPINEKLGVNSPLGYQITSPY